MLLPIHLALIAWLGYQFIAYRWMGTKDRLLTGGCILLQFVGVWLALR